MTAVSPCLFCRIVEKEIPAYVVGETANTLSILDAFPMSQGHVLVLGKKHCVTLDELPGSDAVELMAEAHRLAKKMVSVSGVRDYNVLINNGSAAGQSVAHLHLHLIPRVEGDQVIRFTHGTKQNETYYQNLQKSFLES
jgi:histidine triad (HIT) family protein